jgi:hypothetical protein
MSTDYGPAAVIDEAMRDARELLAGEQAREAQLDLLDPLTSEEMVEAREELGGNASHLAVLKQARANRAGRPKGARNRRTDDLVAYLSEYGPDPAVAAMRIIGTTEELMIQRSISTQDGKRRMTFSEAQAHRMRMIELMLPYWHGKKPVQVDVSFAGVGDLNIDAYVAAAPKPIDVIDADFMAVDDDADSADDGDAERDE